jgi:hypothetical protein
MPGLQSIGDFHRGVGGDDEFRPGFRKGGRPGQRMFTIGNYFITPPNRGTGSNTLAVLRQSISIAPPPLGQRKIMHCVIGCQSGKIE